MLVLRAGVGTDATRSRGAVARRLNLTVRRVVRLERTGLRRLRTLCGAPVMTRTVAETAVTLPAIVGGPAPAQRKARTRSRTAAPDPTREAEGPPSGGGVAGRSATNLPTPAGAGPELLVPLILAVLGLAGYAVGRFVRRPQLFAAAPPPPAAPRSPRRSWSEPPTPSAGGAPDWTTPPAALTGTRSPAPVTPADTPAADTPRAGDTAPTGDGSRAADGSSTGDAPPADHEAPTGDSPPADHEAPAADGSPADHEAPAADTPPRDPLSPRLPSRRR